MTSISRDLLLSLINVSTFTVCWLVYLLLLEKRIFASFILDRHNSLLPAQLIILNFIALKAYSDGAWGGVVVKALRY